MLVFSLKPMWARSIVVFALLVFLLFTSTPIDSGEKIFVTVNEGLSASGISELLDDHGVIYSSLLFRIAILIQGGSREIKAGTYVFERPQSTWRTARRLSEGIFGLSQIKVRVVEGSTKEQIADLFAEKFVSFDKEEFLNVTKDKEGYLFPDTYFFFQDATASDVLSRLESTFNKRIEEFSSDIASSTYSIDEIITMASIIQREVHDPEDQLLVSSVLWNRIDIGMALQVDATLYYLLGKTSSELTLEDLDIDSPYNTYQYRGLPPGPIGSPGRDAILAALNPVESDFFYYLSDSGGITYFAETFEEHKLNKQLYLR